MSAINTTQIASIPFRPKALFTSFQTLGNTTTFEAYPTNLGAPVAIAGDTGVNPVAVFDNRILRVTTILLAFGLTAADGVNMAVDVTGFSQIDKSGLYLRTRFFNGIVTAGNVNVSTALSEATAFLGDNFSTKTFAGGNVSYIEPNDDSSAALLLIDIRGFDFAMIRLAQGGATAATKGQVFLGTN